MNLCGGREDGVAAKPRGDSVWPVDFSSEATVVSFSSMLPQYKMFYLNRPRSLTHTHKKDKKDVKELDGLMIYFLVYKECFFCPS